MNANDDRITQYDRDILIPNLEENIRATENQIGVATQLVVVSDRRYIVGTLAQREGSYKLTMEEPHQDLNGDYENFDLLREAVREGENLAVVGSDDRGYWVGHSTCHIARVEDGTGFDRVGEITFPLLGPEEKPAVTSLD